MKNVRKENEPGKHVPVIPFEVVFEAYTTWGPTEAARRLGMKKSAVTTRICRGKQRDDARPEKERREAETAEAFRKIIDESQSGITADAGTREQPHRYRKGNSVQELFDNHAMVPDNVEITGGRISEHATVTNNRKTGEVSTHVLYAKGANWKARKNPKLLPIKPAATPLAIVHADAPRILRKVKYAVVLSDAQIGFLRNPKTLDLTPTHDRRALEVARRIVQDIAPTVGVGIGDWMDWPVFSRYTQHPEYFATCNASIQEGHDWKAAMVAAAPAGCIWTEVGSNHQIRPEKFVLEHNAMATGVERARLKDQEFQEEWGVFTEPFLLHYQRLGIRMAAAYPGGAFQFVPGFLAMHAPPKVNEFDCDVVHGHVTPITINTNVIYSANPDDQDNLLRKAYFTYGIGGLMSLSANPDKKSIHASLVPAFSSRNKGAQSIMVVEYIEGKLPIHQPFIVHIKEGTALFQGAWYDESSFS